MSTVTPTSRSRMRRFGASLVAGLALFGPLALAPAAHAAAPTATLTLEVAPTTPTEGDTVVVTVRGSGVTDLYAYDLVLSVDDSLLEPTGDNATGPDGGFTSAVATSGDVTVSHTRLGTSPGLSSADPLVLASVPLRTLAPGAARIELSAVRLVSSTGEATTLGSGASASLPIGAPTTPTPVPTASASPTPTPTPTASATPTSTSTPTASASPTPTASASPTPGASGLATTGVDAAVWMTSGAVGIALVAAGTLFVARRRQGVRE
ncbi:hypothetical protein QE410_000433 [Microbacterium sp. SORGH_AS 1204]|uniref:cohesin domain-containing protein n=1 Tax=Microbacterium sp. SORGH_AS_1204 TaxID=3041785 RepID=UPI00279072AA|nr:cohesin domain-containing protein [Microbacterium sp. SORGH_AS_1204]MDQ1135634.1 hypothetical protein [Microbacterium sp. SORGH_AS_1204]